MKLHMCAGAFLVGPLPKETQPTTTCAARLSAATKCKDGAQALQSNGMAPAA